MSNYFSRQELVLEKSTGEKIKTISILTFGAGSAGGEVLKNLSLMGVGKHLIVDFDNVEDCNLAKSVLFYKPDLGKPKALVAAENVMKSTLHENPEVKYIIGNIMKDVGKSVFWDYDFIVCAVDTNSARAFINDWCVRAGKPFIEIGFDKYQVNVSLFAPQGDSYPVCLRDQMGDGDFIEGKRNSCTGLKVKDDGLEVIPTIQFTAAIAGAIAAKEIIRFLEGKSDIVNSTLFYFGETNRTLKVAVPHNSKCKIHDEAFMPVTTVKIAENPTVAEMLEAVEAAVGHQVIVKLPETFVISGRCKGCGKEMVFNKRRSELWDYERWCDDCRKEEDYQKHLDYDSEWVNVSEVSLSSDQEILNRRLRDLKIPKSDVLESLYYEDGEPVTSYVLLREGKPKMRISESEPLVPFDMEDNPEDYYKGCHNVDEDIANLAGLKNFFCDSDSPRPRNSSDFNCYVSKKAFDDFCEFARGVYNDCGHEATGVIAGYYCSDKDGPFSVGTVFIPAEGNTTRVTCEISIEDGIRMRDYCNEHKLLPVCWIHSHPGFDAFFSGTDRQTLVGQYNGVFQTGIVVDFIKKQYAAYRCVDKEVQESDFIIFNNQ